ncbi:MAG TPA: hypothetical protein VK427_06860 [Kofleriaceae bacterium]|nr:hypothetical protein [Kofleriaceae bacterium]
MRRALLASMLAIGLAGRAHAQPAAADDPVLAEQIAQSLVERAQELFEATFYVDAKQLAIEALVRSPRGKAATQAQSVIKASNTALGLVEKPVPETPDSTVVTPLPEPADKPKPVVSGGAVGGAGAPIARRLGSGIAWGGIAGGAFADAVSVDGTTPTHVAVGAAVGASLGGLASYGLAKHVRQTRGDVALMDTLAGIGGVGGLTIGMLMQPAEGEAYSVNAILGIAGGLVVGYVAAPQTNTTERRMLRVAGLSLAGAALPFLLYAGIYDEGTDSDERLVGGLATAGLLAGAYVGFRLTRSLDAGEDVLEGRTDDAPIALIGRHSDGRWRANGVAIAPTSPLLAPQPGMTLSVLGGRF